MRAYDGRGNLVSKARLIEEAGFVVGSHVVRKADETEAKIEGFEGENVIIAISDGLLSGRCKVHVRSFLNREWTKYTPKKEKAVVATLWLHQPQFNDEFIHAYLRGVAMVEIIAHSTDLHETTKHLTVYLDTPTLSKGHRFNVRQRHLPIVENHVSCMSSLGCMCHVQCKF